jgi:hypothetical protein
VRGRSCVEGVADASASKRCAGGGNAAGPVATKLTNSALANAGSQPFQNSGVTMCAEHTTHTKEKSMARPGLPEYPGDLLTAIREMFPMEHHRKLYRFIAAGSAYKIRGYLWKAYLVAARCRELKKAQQQPPGERPMNSAMRRALAREALFNRWQKASAEIHRRATAQSAA